MRYILAYVARLVCAISCAPGLLAADYGPVAANSPAADSLPQTKATDGSSSAASKAEEKVEIVYTSPSGTLQLERIGDDIWVVSTKDPAQRAKLPEVQILGESSYPDEFHSSPNDEWIFSPYHVGSCLRDAVLYRRLNASRIDVLDKFTDFAWKSVVKLGAFKTDFLDEGLCAMAGFQCWSMDSARILIDLRGGEDKREMQQRYLYFNTRKQQFELSDYLRKLNKSKSEKLVCAELVDPLPSETELKAKFDALDQQLNKRYAGVIAKTDKERVANVRHAQRDWIKHRDEGAKFYVSLFPAAEKEQRRLQFLCDVTASRIEVPTDEWDR